MGLFSKRLDFFLKGESTCSWKTEINEPPSSLQALKNKTVLIKAGYFLQGSFSSIVRMANTL